MCWRLQHCHKPSSSPATGDFRSLRCRRVGIVTVCLPYGETMFTGYLPFVKPLGLWLLAVTCVVSRCSTCTLVSLAGLTKHLQVFVYLWVSRCRPGPCTYPGVPVLNEGDLCMSVVGRVCLACGASVNPSSCSTQATFCLHTCTG
jgi:hypothetical protein